MSEHVDEEGVVRRKDGRGPAGPTFAFGLRVKTQQ